MIESEWIEINLPWQAPVDYADYPEQPDLSSQEREIFGFSYDEWEEQNKEITTAWLALKDQLDRSTRGVDRYSEAYQKAEKQFWDQHPKEHQGILTFRATRERIAEWCNQTPEWKAWALAQKAWGDEQDLKSFTGRKLARAGTLVEMDDGSIYLIGNINELGGSCNDCMEFDSNAIVKRYQTVYSLPTKVTSDEN